MIGDASEKLWVAEGLRHPTLRADRAQIDPSVSPGADVIEARRRCPAQFALPSFAGVNALPPLLGKAREAARAASRPPVMLRVTNTCGGRTALACPRCERFPVDPPMRAFSFQKH